jgi:hypothetical protein
VTIETRTEEKIMNRWNRRLALRRHDDAGMATVEYAMVTVAAAAFAAVLIAIIRSPEVREAILGIITRALAGG